MEYLWQRLSKWHNDNQILFSAGSFETTTVIYDHYDMLSILIWQKSTIRSLVWRYVPQYLHPVVYEFRKFSIWHDRWLFVLHTQARSHWFGANQSKLDTHTRTFQQIQWQFLFQFLSIVWWCMIPIAFLALLSGFLFYDNEFEKPSLWIAIYSAFIKNMWGIFGATVITGIALNTGCKCGIDK